MRLISKVAANSRPISWASVDLVPKRGKLRGALGLVLGLAMSGLAGASQYYSRVTLSLVNSNESAGCLYLTISGVSTADAAVSSSPWVGIALSDPAFSMIAATVLQAKATGALVDVATTGTPAGGACGAVSGIAAVLLD